MSDPYLAEIRLFSFPYPVPGWADCDGSLVSKGQYSALYSLIGSLYGQTATTFALPNYSGRIPVHASSAYAVGDEGGVDFAQLWPAMLPAHTHQAYASSGAADQTAAAGGLWTNGGQPAYTSAAPNVLMSSNAILKEANQYAHENRAPYFTLRFCICIAGLYPS